MAYVLRDYQQAAVNSVLEHFRRSREAACVVLPTGAGKSLVIAELARLAKGPVLCLSHVKELCEQNSEKQRALGVASGIYSAGLGRKEVDFRVIHGTVQSVARNLEDFEEPVSLLIVDECHRVSMDTDTEYARVLRYFREKNARVCVLGLTATPYRLDEGYVFERNAAGRVVSEEEKPFRRCVHEVKLMDLIERGYLSPPRLENASTAYYDFSELPRRGGGTIPTPALNSLLGRTKRVTESIVRDAVARAEQEARRGVMFFAATVEHAREVFGYLPQGSAALILGETESDVRDASITNFKAGKVRYLVNVSVLTTGFDAPHVDFIAILRPTESVALFQQMVGRGLRLSPGKSDCLVVDYADSGFSLTSAEVPDRKTRGDSVPVKIVCPLCRGENLFWGKVDSDGDVVEHYGRRCQNIVSDDGVERRCEYRFRFKECDACGAENDIAARVCGECQKVLVDPDEKLKAALGLRDCRVLRVSGMTMEGRAEVLTVTYHDEDGTTLSERFDFENKAQIRAFFAIFGRRAGGGARPRRPTSVAEVLRVRSELPHPDFVVGQRPKKSNYFRVKERFFDYEGRYRKAF